jgi:TRAP-type C4-dicarboxylate transport system permease small subunit
MAEGSHDHAVLDYASARAVGPRRQSALGVASCAVLILLCVWFVWGALHQLDLFYSTGGPAGGVGPVAAARWERVVAGVGTAGAAGGIAMAVAALRAPDRAHHAAVFGFACNSAAVLLYGLWLISLL